MKKILWIVLAVLMSACSAAEGQSFQATPRAAAYGALNSVTPETVRVTSTPTPDELATAYAVIAFDEATSTAESAATSTAFVVTSTESAKATAQFFVEVTFQVATQRATETQVAGTQISAEKTVVAGTAAPQTATAIKATQVVEETNLNTTLISMWVLRVGFAVFVVGFLIFLVVILFRGIPIAENIAKKLGDARVMKQKTDALKGADRVPSSVLEKDETLIIPDMAHRAAINPHHDDLTSEQALENTKGFRELQIAKSIAESPLMAKYMARDLHKQGMTPFSVKITKPEEPQGAPQPERPLISVAKELPAPHYKKLFAWDGELLPFGVDEAGELMRVDLAKRPQLMVCGMSGSGKSRSVIRTMIACSLIQGDNVFVLGKQVDYFPFEGHPNFRILPTRNLRTDASKYIDVTRRLTDQMDVRDEILVSSRKSTWAHYGGPQTIFVLDDITGTILNINAKDRTAFLEEILRIAMDGRKYGLNLLLGVQRPTADTIDTRLRSQLARISLRVERASESKIAIDADGAQYLPDGHFLTRLTTESELERGVGFSLDDNEAEAFWRSRPIKENEPMSWIDAVVETVEEDAPATVTPETFSVSTAEAPSVPEDDFRSRILNVYLAKLSLQRRFSLRDIEREVFGFTGGKAHDTVKKVIAETEQCEVSEVSAVLNEMFSKWNLATTDDATTVLFGENGQNQPDIAAVAG